VEESVEEPEEKGDPYLCLAPCPKCKAAGYRGGACHLGQGHSERHECNAVGGEMHSWWGRVSRS
jgi:hypothetical protein